MKFLKNGIDISDSDVKCLSNDLLDIEDWITEAIRGKINNCKKRMLEEWHPRLLIDPDVQSIPAEESTLIDFITKRKDYKNRETREREDLIEFHEYFSSPEYLESLEVADADST